MYIQLKGIAMLKKILPLVLLATCSQYVYAADDITERTYGDVKFKQTRLVSNETDYLKLPKQWAESYGSDSPTLTHIDKKLAELVRLRVSQVDQCNYCMILHTKQAVKLAIPQSKISSLSTWTQSELFSVKEKAAFMYADTVSQLKHDDIQEAYDGLTNAGFTSAEKEEITNTVLLMNIWSRIFMVQGKTSIPTE